MCMCVCVYVCMCVLVMWDVCVLFRLFCLLYFVLTYMHVYVCTYVRTILSVIRINICMLYVCVCVQRMLNSRRTDWKAKHTLFSQAYQRLNKLPPKAFRLSSVCVCVCVCVCMCVCYVCACTIWYTRSLCGYGVCFVYIH